MDQIKDLSTNLLIDDNPSRSLATIREQLADLKERNEMPAIVVIDNILNLDPDSTYTLDDVNKAYYKRLQEMSASREKGIEPTYELKEYQSAKQVMNDFYAYAAFRN